ncbi:AAA family ATPase [Shinella sp. H4-D48]|uniref:AAA family ATPase n=1 Tax=Shinella sp. H4-D48 TaxID=2925841 RepID=UPI001F52F7EC|nr:AAA family ATPase [Shinella sp. H4-D48]UNK37709.1 AAA family ATPase [Shinella sp. H4-D48]
MSRFDPRPSFEAAIARLHFIDVITTLGQEASGTYIVTVPEETEAEKWLRPALAYIQAIQHVSDIEEAVDGVKPQAAYDAALLTADGIYSGHTGARCALYLTEAGHDDLRHPSVRLADGIIDVGLDPELVVQAAAEMGRDITADEAKLLISMPWRHRRLALLSPRPVPESHDLHLLALEAEAAAKVVEDLRKAEKDEKKNKTPKRIVPDVRPLDELHGYGEAKNWGLELARDIDDWRRGDIAWSDVDNGVLLSGPPGCGKTTYAAALAKTLDAHFVSGSYSAWLGTGDGHQGNLIIAMRAAFDEARLHAPSVILIDEIDNFVQRGSIGDGRADEWTRGVVNALLECMDGALEREGVVVVGATNDASGIDTALRRAGRLDRHIGIKLPDREARLAILAQHLDVGEDFALDLFGRHTEGMSGADLERLARDARRNARRDRCKLKHQHVARAFPRRTRRSDDDIRHIAAHEIGHAVVAAVLGARVHEVFVQREYDPAVSAQVAGAAVVQTRETRRDYQWHLDRVAHILGGMAAEQMVYGAHTDGVIVDLSEATNMLTYVLSTVGMGESLGSDGHRDPAALVNARQFDPRLRQRVEDILQEQAVRARDILERNRSAFHELAERLAARCRLDGEEVHAVVDGFAQPQLSLAI